MNDDEIRHDADAEQTSNDEPQAQAQAQTQTVDATEQAHTEQDVEYKDDVEPRDERVAENSRKKVGEDSQDLAAPAPGGAEDDGGADPSDFFVERDGQGNLQTVATDVEGFGEVEIKPMTYGDAQEYFGDAGQIAMAGPETVANVLRNHVVDPDLETFCKQKYGKVVHGQTHYLNASVVRDEMNPFAPQLLLANVLEESGLNADVEMDDQGQAAIDFGEGGNP